MNPFFPLNKRTDKFSGSGKQASVRPGLLVGLLVVAGLAVLVAVLFSGRKSPPPAAGNASSVTPAAVNSTSSAVQIAANAGTYILTTNPQAKVDGAVTGTVAPTGLDVAALKELIRKLKDPSLSADERNRVIKAIAENGSPEALAALKDALVTGTEDLRAAVAEGLGACASQECTTMLLGLLHDSNEAVIQAAVRGLAQQGTPQAATALAQVLYDSQQSLDVRAEAALGLGTINQPGVMDTLSQAALVVTDENLVTQILTAIGTRNISETQPFLENYLRSPNVSSDLKVEAMESLWQAKGNPSAFLTTAAGNQDADIRAAAAWALSATDEVGQFGPQLMGMLQAESDPDVRLRLYQALSNQENLDIGNALTAVQKETDPSARVSGLDLLAKQLRDHPTAELQSFFDQTATPELKKTALTGDTSDDRMRAVVALTRARTPGTMAALQEVGQQSTDPRVKDSVQRMFTP